MKHTNTRNMSLALTLHKFHNILTVIYFESQLPIRILVIVMNSHKVSPSTGRKIVHLYVIVFVCTFPKLRPQIQTSPTSTFHYI